MVYYISLKRTCDHQAGAKAPNDIYTLCQRRGWKEAAYPSISPWKDRKSYRVARGLMVSAFWLGAFRWLKAGDVVFYQHPVRYGSKIAGRYIRLLREKKKVRFVLLIHDLDSLRYGLIYADAAKTNVYYEDGDFLREFDCIICHNERMKAYLLEQGLPEEKLICLELFDYLTDGGDIPAAGGAGIAVAGNLDRKKSGYVYELAGQYTQLPLHLYGLNYDSTAVNGQNVTYYGSFEPDRLPSVLRGRYGIVWDGSRLDTCEGASGNYLRYNNPHKLSLFMAAGMPVITWKEAAVADFVEKHRVGLAVDSLETLSEALAAVSEEEYERMRERIREIREKVTAGSYFNRAVDEALKRLGISDGAEKTV